ncbi:MAG: putative tail tube protein [Prokaryotic dsDNA virus sp.]|jgi:predicted secreted protein|nr:MAG: putative tail tube protein [Prokaryotic dsDNA virus sp.]|tara:strand:+ start:2821 stop:3252 length:432 start_codon:yes stop_codon:yes gene_type:complete
MATVGPFNGTNLLLKFDTSDNNAGSTVICGHTTSCELSLSADLPESTTKNSSGFQEVIAGVKSAEISFEGLVAYDDANNAIEAADFLIAGTKVDWSFGTAETGDAVYSGKGFLSSVTMSGEMESPVTFSGSITSTSNVTKATN